MDFLSNPNLETFNPQWPGNPFENGRFKSYGQALDPQLGDLFRYLSGRNPQAAQKASDRYVPAFEPGDIRKSGDWICWLGHASFLIQLSGFRVLVDPVWQSLGLIKRRLPMPFSLAQLGPIDYLLITHDHRDHCEEKTIKSLSALYDFEVFAPLGFDKLIKPWLKRKQKVTEMGWYQSWSFKPEVLKISFMPTQHWGRRLLSDTNRRLWGSFVLQTQEHSIWLASDSAYSDHFTELKQYFPKVDLATIGIGAYSPSWFMQKAHTSPEQAWRGFEDCGAMRVMPMHFGTYDLSWEPAGEPIRLFRDQAMQSGRMEDLLEPVLGKPLPLD